jgi:2,3-bisphosphoglycerate-independent phosphoglycerate mutase
MLVGGAVPGRNAPLKLRDGKLADVAPTLLELIGLEQPREMTGHTLLVTPDNGDGAGHARTRATA